MNDQHRCGACSVPSDCDGRCESRLNKPAVALGRIEEIVARADEAHMRVKFERRCLEHFKAKRDAGVPIIDDNGSPATAEALFWRDQNGQYGVQAFNVAWIAFRWGVEFGRSK